MPIPGFQDFLLPLLEIAGDGQEHIMADVLDELARRFAISEAERNELLASGRQRRFDNRVSWARTYLQKAGLLLSTGRGRFRIGERGLLVLKSNPQKLDLAYLSRFPEFKLFHNRVKAKKDGDLSIVEQSGQTPRELLESTYQTLRQELVQDLLDMIKQHPASLFERLVLDLLLAMGYGGSRKEAVQALGRTGDEGVDGLIDEDRLGLDRIYIQAKRWQGTVGRPVVQGFAGALMGRKARKGVLITTATFSEEARRYAHSVEGLTIVLIDGEQLAQLLIDYNVGVTEEAHYILKKINSDYFEQ
jgi:restriction system protein